MGFMSNLLVLSTLLVGIDAEASLLQKARVSGHSSKAMNLQSEVMNLESEAMNLEAEGSTCSTICTETITMGMSSMKEVMSSMTPVECDAISGDNCGLTFKDKDGDPIDDSCVKHKQECEDGKISFMKPSEENCVVEVATKHYFVFKLGDTYYGNAPRSGNGCGLAEIKQTNENKDIFGLDDGDVSDSDKIVAALGSTNFTCSCKITNFESVTVVDEFKPTAVTVPKPSSKAPFQQTMANVGKVILATVMGDCAAELTKGSKKGWPTKQGGCKFETSPVEETSPVSDQDAPNQGDDDDQ